MPGPPPSTTRQRRPPPAPAPLRAEAGVEPLLHAACVKAGAAAALQVTLERLPMLKPMLPRAITEHGRGDAPERIQRVLVKEIYLRYRVKPAPWELEGILAVAQTQGVLAPLASQESLKGLLRAWVPEAVSNPLVRFTPLEPLVTATARAVAATWAAGRYADSVCRLRRAGADWLPAPLADALNLAPATLRRWSVEALTLALPPLRLATRWGLRAAEIAAPVLRVPRIPTPAKPRASAGPRAAAKPRAAADGPRAAAKPRAPARKPRAPVKKNARPKPGVPGASRRRPTQ